MATGYTAFPEAIDDESTLIGVSQWPLDTTLRLDVTETETVLPVENALLFAPAPNVVEIEGERIVYTGKGDRELTGCLRGQFPEDGGRPPHGYRSGTLVKQRDSSTHHRVLLDALMATQTELAALQAVIRHPLYVNFVQIDNESTLSTYVWTNMPTAETELFGLMRSRRLADLTDVTQVRVFAQLGVAGSANAVLYLQYSTNDGSTWNDLTTSHADAMAINTTTHLSGAWTNIVMGSKALVLLRVVGASGNATTDPQLLYVSAQFR